MFDRFFPDQYVASTYVIDFEKLYKEGIRGVIFDIDNTLVPHGAPADERAIRLFARLRSIGLDYCLISNNQLPSVKPFADAVQAKFVEDAHKPSRKNYLKAMKLMHVDLDSCIFVRDFALKLYIFFPQSAQTTSPANLSFSPVEQLL